MPKKSSPDLFDLIQSLTKSEKRYFKIYTTRNKYGQEKQYIKLFDIIDKQSEYDEEKVLKKAPEIKKFSVVKNQLYNLVLKSLSSLHADKKITMHLRSKLDHIEILFHKGLYKQAKKLLAKTKSLAYQYEEFSLILELLNIEHQLLTNAMAFKSIQKFGESVESWSSEKAEILEKIDNLRMIQTVMMPFIKLHFEGIQHREDETKKYVENLINHPILQDIEQNISISSRLTYHLIWTIYYNLINNSQKAFEHCQTRLALLEKNKLFIEKDFSRYIYTIKFCLDNSIELMIEKEIGLLLKKLNKAVSSSPSGFDQNVEAAIFITQNLAKFDYAKSKFDYPTILKEEKTILDGLNRFSDMINPGIQIELLYYIGYAYFCSGEYHASLKYLNKILNDRFTGVKCDVFNITRILNLIVHYEIGNTDLTDYISKSYMRTLDKKNVYYDIDQAIIQLVNKLANAGKDSEKKSYLYDFRDYLLSIQFKLKDLKLYKYFDVDIWLAAKLEDQSISEFKKLKK